MCWLLALTFQREKFITVIQLSEIGVCIFEFNYETLKHKPFAIVISVRRLFFEMRLSTEYLELLFAKFVNSNLFRPNFQRLSHMKIW